MFKIIHKSFTDNYSNMSFEMEVQYSAKSSFIKSNFPFLHKYISLRGCLILTGEIKISTETISWSDRPGRILAFWRRNGTFVNTKSKILFSLVGLVTT